MTKFVGQTFNTNDTPTMSAGIAVNNSTATLILAAQSAGDNPRLKVTVRNNGNKDVWVKLQAASVDNNKRGIFIPKQESKVLFDITSSYPGEISAISDSGSSTIYVTEI